MTRFTHLANVSTNTHGPESLCSAVAESLGGSVVYDEELDGEVAGVLYFASETRTYYVVDATACLELVERVHASDEDAYSLWCASTMPCGEGPTSESALSAAGVVL